MRTGSVRSLDAICGPQFRAGDCVGSIPIDFDPVSLSFRRYKIAGLPLVYHTNYYTAKREAGNFIPQK